MELYKCDGCGAVYDHSNRFGRDIYYKLLHVIWIYQRFVRRMPE